MIMGTNHHHHATKSQRSKKSQPKAKISSKLVTLAVAGALIWVGGHALASAHTLPPMLQGTHSTPPSVSGGAATASTKASASRQPDGGPAAAAIEHTAKSAANGSASQSSLAGFTVQAFEATGAKTDGYEVNNWTKLSDKFESEKQLSDVVTKLEQELHMASPKTVSHHDSGDGHSGQTFYEAYGSWGDQTNVSVTASSFKFASGPDETILVIRADSTGSNLKAFADAVSQIQTAVQSLGAQPQISCCVEGFLDAKMNGGQSESLVRKTFKAVAASEIEGVQTGSLTSISGYSTKLPQYILTRGRKMNIQVGLHYDTVHQRTNVVVGAPIVTVTY